MSREYKQLIKAFMAYAFGFWAASYLYILFLSLFADPATEPKVKTLFSGEYGLIVGIFLLAFLAFFSGIPFYIWLAIRQAMLKEKLNTQGLFKCAFIAGILCPFFSCLVLWSLISLSLRSETSLIFILLSITAALAESCIKINKNIIRRSQQT